MCFEVCDNLVSLMMFGSGLNGTAICCQVNDKERSKERHLSFFIVSQRILN
jgi:hypothetical protein